jgi:membrane protease YdiL (CAAX protease family)
MTALAPTLAPTPLRRPGTAVAAVALGCAALAARPLFVRSTTDVVMLFAALLAVGTLWPVARVRLERVAPIETVVVLLVGVAAFALGRAIGGGHPPAPFALRLVALNGLAAIAEEALFRRLLFGALERHGAVVAVAGSTVLFAVVHVTVYGWWVLPIDIGAGLVLSWQRWATGNWTVPAVTHVLANVLVVI